MREIRDAAEKVRINRIIDCEYAEKIEALPLRSFSGKLGDLESSLCREQELRPMTELALHLEISYTSPAGRNHYHRRFVYGQDKLFTAIEQSHRTVTEQERRRQERAKITPKLRHQILERDHYRCVHCGASAVEGAKLHVDHIVPISQGGKTEMGNLQTLCEQCNLGKGNSMPRC